MATYTGADIEYNGKKIAGSAQFRKRNTILQHGSILIHQDFARLAQVFGVFEEDLNCINLTEILKTTVPYEKLSLSIKKGFIDYFNIVL